MKIISLEQGTQEWLDYRKGKIGSSHASAIMGVSPWTTRLQQWEKIIFDEPTPVNAAMERGRMLEPLARNYLNEKYGWFLEPQVVEHPIYNWHFSSLDGLYFDPVIGWVATEIKAAGKEDHQKAARGQIPEKYIPQLVHQLEDLNIDKILYLSYSNDSQHEVWFHRDTHQCQIQIAEETAFYASIINFQPPEPSDKDMTTIDDPTLKEMAQKYIELSQDRDLIEKELSLLKKELIQYAKTSKTQIGSLIMQKIIRAGGIDYKAIPQLKELDLSPYQKKPVESWRFVKRDGS